MFRGRHWPLALMHRHAALGWARRVHYSALTLFVKLHTCAETQVGCRRGAAGLPATAAASHALEAAVLKFGLQPAGLLRHARRLGWVCRLRVAWHLGVTEDSGAEPGPSSVCCFVGRRSTGHTVPNSSSPASLKVRRRPGRSISSTHSTGSSSAGAASSQVAAGHKAVCLLWRLEREAAACLCRTSMEARQPSVGATLDAARRGKA